MGAAELNFLMLCFKPCKELRCVSGKIKNFVFVILFLM